VTADRTAQINALLAQLAGLLVEPASSETESRPTARDVPPRLLLTVEEAAEQLGIGKTTTYALVRSGDLESVQIGRLRRIHIDAVAAYAARLVQKNRAA
jgi:excisionase family DNA binding protein